MTKQNVFTLELIKCFVTQLELCQFPGMIVNFTQLSYLAAKPC